MSHRLLLTVALAATVAGAAGVTTSGRGVGRPTTDTATSTQQAPAKVPADPTMATPPDYVLLTCILKHDQSRNLAELQQVMKENGFWTAFPPEGIQVDSWYAVMGLGQLVTLRVPPARLREVNLALERTAWKVFRTEIYASYDLRAVAAANRAQAAKETSRPR